MGFWHWGTWWNWGAGWAWILIGIVFLVFLTWVVVSIVRGRPTYMGPMCGMGSHIHSQEHNHSLEILKERYARGEISREQFEQMKKDLEK
ncbi:MAG: SHOCT domain-containing protein [Coprothermobacterota bacterium]|nr:SHOCT domain-containing protein [Coprothermobacterota bacterium]